ncbi:MAG: hypothetical protein K2L89_07190 [Muribaculaceae bacterium]|nr:hypothetical protein [Muribaculaceae bacterium]
MNRIVYHIFSSCLFAAFLFISCTHKPAQNTAVNDSITLSDSVNNLQDSDESSADYSDIVFNSPQNVMEFIHFKRFEDSHGFVAFNGKGGVIADEAFNTDSVIVKDKKSAEIFISVPKMKMTGTLLLKVEEKRVILVDEETKADYKLIN